MKAVISERYGSPDVLELKDIERPVAGEGEVLVRVHAAAMNAADAETLVGTFMARAGGLRRPRYRILGTDVAGRVEAVGIGAGRFRAGDEVFGDLSLCGYGAFAEYVSVPEKALAPKPACLTFEQAAAVPTAAVLALQGLRDRQPIQPRDRVLINGAGGGVGTFAVQIAKWFGAEVTGVDGCEKLDRLRALGADHVIDYAEEDFTGSGRRYERILDVVAGHSVAAYRRALSPGGRCVLIGGSVPRILQAALLGSVGSRTGKKVGLLTSWEPNREDDMAFLTARIEAGDIAPVIDSTYPLTRIGEAFRRLAARAAQGKIVVSIVDGSAA